MSEGSRSWGSPLVMNLYVFWQSNVGTVKARGKRGPNAGSGSHLLKSKHHLPPPTLHALVSIITLTMTLWPKCKHGLFWRKGLILYFLAFVKTGNLTLKKVIQV